jgi:hypothetical protein
VHAALLAALAVHGQFFRVEPPPLVMAATTLRWPGMIQKNTLALMAVAIIAPTSRKAARPANRLQASQDAKATTASISTPDDRSPFLRKPNALADQRRT